MLQSINEGVQYVMQSLQELEAEPWKSGDVSFVLTEYLSDNLAGEMTPVQHADLMEHIEDDTYIEAYIEQHAPNFHTVLQKAVTTFLAPYYIIET